MMNTAQGMEPGLVPTPSDRGLIAAFDAETRLLDRLGELMRRQREGVASDDVQVVDDSVFGIHRILHTVGEARRRRNTVLENATGVPDVTLDGLEAAFGPKMSDALRQARDRLKAAARALAREVKLNREVLRLAIQSGETYMQSLYGGEQTQIGYDSDARAVEDSQRVGTLLNRKV